MIMSTLDNNTSEREKELSDELKKNAKKKKKAAIKRKTKRYGYKGYYKVALTVIFIIAAILIGWLVFTSESCRTLMDDCTWGKNCAACSDTSWAAKFDIKGEDFLTDEQIALYFSKNNITPTDVQSEEVTVTGGLYRYFVLQVFKELSETKDSSGKPYVDTTVDPTSQTINGMRADKFIDQKAELLLREFIVLRRQFDALGFKLDYSEMPDKVEEYTTSYNASADYYKANGISLDSFLMGAIDFDYMEGLVMGAKYAQGGYEEYTIDDMRAALNVEYIAQSYIVQYYLHEDGTQYTDAEKAAKKAEFEGIIAASKAGTTDFAALSKEYKEKGKTDPHVLGSDYKTIRIDFTDPAVLEMSKLGFGDFKIFEYDDYIMLMRRNAIDESVLQYNYSRFLIEFKLKEFEQDLEANAKALTDVDFNEGCLLNMGLTRFDIPYNY